MNLLLGATLLLCGALLGSEVYLLDGRTGFPLDDSWIHLAFARNLAAGHGMALDPGHLVAGSTGPLWTALAAPGAAVPVDDLAWMKLLGIGFHLAGVGLTWLLARGLGLGRGLAFLAAALTAGTGWLLWSALSGLEIPLFVCLALAGMVLHLAERADPGRPPLSLPVLGLAILARPEGLVLLACAAADRLLRFERRPDGALVWVAPAPADLRRLGAGLLLAGLAVVPLALFHVAIGGSPLPTTLGAKTAGGPTVHLPRLRYLHEAAGVLFRSHPWLTVLAPAGAVAMVRGLGRRDDRGLLPVLWLAGLPLAYACIDPRSGAPLLGNFGRYLFPLFPVLVVVGILGLRPLAEALGADRPGTGRGVRLRRLAAVLALALLVTPTLASGTRTAGLYLRNVSDVEAGDVRMARWLAGRLPEEAVLAAVDIGALAAILPNRIVDVAGIADPELHDHLRRARERDEGWQAAVLRFLAERRPDYLVAFPDWLGPIERPGSPFRRVHTVRVPGNVTLGGDTVVLYSTPWTRYPLRSGEITDPAEGEPSP